MRVMAPKITKKQRNHLGITDVRLILPQTLCIRRKFSSSEYKIAEAKDELMWRESVQRRIAGRKQKD